MNRQGRVVVASLDNDKIYVGQINSVTTDPDETLKLVAMVNFLSGTRNAASSSGVGVVYNYGIEYDPNAPTILYLDFNNIVSISEFSIESFINSIESGYALIEEIALVQFTACLLAIEYISSEDELLSRLQ
jgi:hypothetical protein